MTVPRTYCAGLVELLHGSVHGLAFNRMHGQRSVGQPLSEDRLGMSSHIAWATTHGRLLSAKTFNDRPHVDALLRLTAT